MRRARTLALAAALACGAPLGALAMSVPAYDLDALAQMADLVIRGLVVSTSTVVEGRRVHTRTEIQVRDAYGDDAPETVEVSTPGGVAGDLAVRVAGTETYRLGEEVIVFLDGGPDGIFVSIGGALTKFTVEAGPVPTATRSLEEVHVVDAPEEPLSTGVEAPRFTLQGLEAIVRSARAPVPR